MHLEIKEVLLGKFLFLMRGYPVEERVILRRPIELS